MSHEPKSTADHLFVEIAAIREGRHPAFLQQEARPIEFLMAKVPPARLGTIGAKELEDIEARFERKP